MTDLVQEAFAAGWAVHADELGRRGRLAFLSAQEAVDEDDPEALDRVFEVAKQQSLLVTLEKRRARVRKRNVDGLGPIMEKLARAFPTKAYVATIRRDLRVVGLLEAAAQTDGRRQRAKRAALAALLALLAKKPKLDARWLALIAEARAQAMAEGWAEGHLLTAALLKTGEIPDLDVLYKETLAQLRDAGTVDPVDASWLREQVEGLAGDIAQRIAHLAGSGGTRAEMAAAVNEALSAGEGPRTYLDEQMHAAMSRAVGSAYIQLGLGYVNWQTEDDGRVCPTCQGYEDSNPWPIDSAPSPPAHSRCRCWASPAA